MGMIFQFPTREADLLAFLRQYSALIGTGPTTYGLTAAQATTLDTQVTAFQTALLACAPAVRNQTAVVTKNAARDLVKTTAHNLAMIAGVSTASAAQKLALGIRPRATATPSAVPGSSPIINVMSVNGRVVKIALHGDGGGARPKRVKGASVFSAAGGDAAPTDPAAWNFAGLVTGRKLSITVPGTAASTLWVTASWFSNRGQTGVAAQPVRINLPAASPVPQSDTMKIAA